MDLTVKEVATLTGRSPRTIRSALARGELPGVKRNGAWSISRHDVPLTESQRRRLQARADEVRRVVDDVLPSRLAATSERGSRSLADLAAFHRGAALLKQIAGAPEDSLPAQARVRALALIEAALLAVAEGSFHYDRELKLAAIHRARAQLARALATILVHAGIPPAAPAIDWALALETEVIPAVAGLARWAERLGRRECLSGAKSPRGSFVSRDHRRRQDLPSLAGHHAARGTMRASPRQVAAGSPARAVRTVHRGVAELPAVGWIELRNSWAEAGRGLPDCRAAADSGWEPAESDSRCRAGRPALPAL